MKKLLFNSERNIIEILKQCRDENEAQLVLRSNDIYLTAEEIKNIKEQFNKTFNEDEILTPEQLENIAGGGFHYHIVETSKLTPDQLKNHKILTAGKRSFAIIGIEYRENDASKEEYAGIYLHLHDKYEEVSETNQGHMSYSSEMGFVQSSTASLTESEHHAIVSPIHDRANRLRIGGKNPDLKLHDLPKETKIEPSSDSLKALTTAFRDHQAAHKTDGEKHIAEPSDTNKNDKAIYKVCQQTYGRGNGRGSTITRRRNPQPVSPTPPTSPTVVRPQPQYVPAGTPLKAAASTHTPGASVSAARPPVKYFDHEAYVKNLTVPDWSASKASQFSKWEQVFDFFGTTVPVSGQPLTIRQAIAHCVFLKLCKPVSGDGKGPLDLKHENFSKAFYIANTICHDDLFINFVQESVIQDSPESRKQPKIDPDILYKTILIRMQDLNTTPTLDLGLAAAPSAPPVAAQTAVSPTGNIDYDQYKKDELPTLQGNILSTLGDGRCLENTTALSSGLADPESQSGSRIKLVDNVFSETAASQQSRTGADIPPLTEAQRNENSLRLFYGITD